MAGASHMRFEIDQQPATLAATYAALAPSAARVRGLIDSRRRVLFLARGTSDNAATYGRYLMEISVGKPASSGAPSVATLYDSALDLTDTVAIVISQSGETEELVEAADWARRNGAHTVALTNSTDSTLVDMCHDALVTPTGTERAVPATKSFTAQLLTLAMVAGPHWAHDLADVGDEVGRLLDDLAMPGTLDETVNTLLHARSVVCTGRGFALAAALEAALKLTETTGIPCAGLSLADLQHGPLAMLSEHVPLMVYGASTGPTLGGLTAIAESGRLRGSPVVRVGGDTSAQIGAGAFSEELAPIGLTVVAQVLAEATSRRRGIDPDAPLGLTKVTQTAR